MKHLIKYNNNVNFEGIVVIWGPRILICRQTVSFIPNAKQRTQMPLKGGKSKSQCLQWQQYRLNEHIIIIANDYTIVGHYTMCNREKMKTL